MKGLILSGGSGTRLRPITYTSAKQLVPIANKPILFYAIESMIDAGIKEIGIVVGHTADEIKTAVGNRYANLALIEYIHQDEPLGLAHCVSISRNFLQHSPFVMYLGDNMLQASVSSFVGVIPNGADAAILVKEVDNPSSFGIVELDENMTRPLKLVEKPQHPKSNLAMVGVYYFTDKIYSAVERIGPSARGELEITDAIQLLINDGLNVHCSILEGWWIDTGKKDPLLECNRIVLDSVSSQVCGRNYEGTSIEGRVNIDSGASIKNSRISGPVVIAQGAVIVNSYIGPYTSIGQNCFIESSEIENSILLDGCKISNIGTNIRDSIVGKNANVTSSIRKPKSLRLAIGDDSTVEM